MAKQHITEQKKLDSKVRRTALLLSTFREECKKSCQVNHLAVIYTHLFSLKNDSELQEELEYLYTLYNGTDSHFKKSGKDCWFEVWH